MVARPRRATIHDVAERAGVSATTVSHAFSGNGTVADETRRRVRQAAQDLGYLPDVLVRRQRSNRLAVVALVVRPLEGLRRDEVTGVDYFLRFAGAAALAALAEGYGLMLVADPTRPGATGAILASDGFLVTEPVIGDPLVALLEGGGIPYVTVGEVPDRDHDQPAIDIETPRLTGLALDHLAESGARKIALVIGTERNEWNLRSAAAYRRWVRGGGQSPIVVARRETMSERGGRSAVRALFDADEPPDACYCLTGPHALGLLEGLRERGLRVPEDVRLLVGSDTEQARLASPPLSAIDLQPEELARHAVAALLARMRGDPMPRRAEGVGRLVVRASTAHALRQAQGT